MINDVARSTAIPRTVSLLVSLLSNNKFRLRNLTGVCRDLFEHPGGWSVIRTFYTATPAIFVTLLTSRLTLSAATRPLITRK